MKRKPNDSGAAVRRILVVVVLAVIVIVAYSPSLRGGFVWDDDRYVSNNPLLFDLDGLWRIWTDLGATVQYYPLTFTTFWVEQHLWGLEPAGYRIVNLLLHLSASLLVWKVLRQLSVPGAALAAAIFALHPVHTESVAWITERKNVLSASLGLAATFYFLRYSGWCTDTETQKPRLAFYLLAIAFFAAGLLAKTAICTLPAGLLLIAFWKRGRVTLRDIAIVSPFLIMGLAMAMITTWVEQEYVGASIVDSSLPLFDRILLAGRVYVFYAAKLLCPYPLSFIYERWTTGVQGWIPLLYPLAAIGVLGLLWCKRHRWGRGPFVALLINAVLLFPILGFFGFYFQRYSYVADHFQYLPSISLIALLVAIGCHLTSKSAPQTDAKSTSPYRYGQVAGVVILLIFGGLSMRRADVFRDIESLWRDTLDKNPSCWLAYNNLGAIYEARNEREQARENFTKAIEYNPLFVQAHFNLGVSHLGAGEHDQAKVEFERTIELKPDHARARVNLAQVHFAAHRPQEAETQLKRALETDPDFAKALYNLGLLCHQRGDTESAIDHYRQAIESDADYGSAHFNLANLLASQNRIDEAMHHWSETIRCRPNWPQAHYNLGSALTDRGDLLAARPHLETAVRLKPNYTAARLKLGFVAFRSGDTQTAVRELKEVLKQDPNNKTARTILSKLEQLPTRKP